MTDCVILTFLFGLALHLQVHGGEAELVAFLWGQLIVLLQAVAHAEAAAHCGHLAVELLPRDLVVESHPAELDLDAVMMERSRGQARRKGEQEQSVSKEGIEARAYSGIS